MAPLDRTCPKPFIDLLPEGPPIVQAARLVGDRAAFAPPIVMAAVEHRGLTAVSLGDMGAGSRRIVLEPSPRGTAAAAAAAAQLIVRSEPDALMLLLPTDFQIDDALAFREALSDATAAALEGSIALLGVRPNRPSTAFGYIRAGEETRDIGRARRATQFIEKPSRETAARLVAEGGRFWNTGIALMPAALLLAELARFEPELVAHAREAVVRSTTDGEALFLDAQCFSRCRPVSIDRALMERSDRLAVVPLACGWTDLGSWTTLAEASARDAAGNSLIGDVLAGSAGNSYIRTTGPRVVAVGVQDLIVVVTGDAVLVAHKDRDQEIGLIMDRLSSRDAD